MQSISICLSLGAAALLQSSYTSSIAYDRPVHTLILALFLCALTLNAADRTLPFDLKDDRPQRKQYELIPLGDRRTASAQHPKDTLPTRPAGLTARKHVGLLALAILVVILRIEIHRYIAKAPQCVHRSYEGFLPLLLTINECRHTLSIKQETAEEGLDDVLHDDDGPSVFSIVSRHRWRYVPSALLIGIGSYMTAGLWKGLETTVICPIASSEAVLTPRLQILAVILDLILSVIADELTKSGESSIGRPVSALTSYSIVMIGAALCWVGFAIALYVLQPDYRHWLLMLDVPSRSGMLLAMIWQALLFSAFFVATVNWGLRLGVLSLSVFITTFFTLIAGAKFLWSTKRPFPPISSSASLWSLVILYIGCLSFHRIGQAAGSTSISKSSTWQTALTFALIFSLLPNLYKSNGVYFHPIDLLVYDARTHHDEYVKYARYSTSLRAAIEVYKFRYQDEPPPGFDVWYEYARNRSAFIIDDFDQIYTDLLPFRTVAPQELRQRTWEAVSNYWNEISGISIRNGKAEVQENVLPTHRWMLEGVATLINSFAQYLPDMDIAFNLNDESRVAVPHSQISSMRRIAEAGGFRGNEVWSTERATGWRPVATEEFQGTEFENWSFQNSYARFGSVGCPPNSRARSQPQILSQGSLCLKCTEPHSLGQFVSNWSLLANPCHQPDLAYLHGFYLSPAAFKTTHQLIPIFSQSKVSGYNDILYPSAWNYMDKAVYAPINASGVWGTDTYEPGFPDLPFSEKENKLFWRGATSEGVSDGSKYAWRGMARQRLVHMTNNLTNTEHDYATLLLPDPRNPENFLYQSLSAKSLATLNLLQATDVSVVDFIARCGGVDCTDQASEFGLVGPVDFQKHWRYRYLFDMDGAGFSGRFLPFLHSHSLPFKTAIFREWYDSRLTAWRHFVPQDIRLHGLWSTLAYFAGVDGFLEDGRTKVKWEGHTKEGEIIAEEGRKWAGKVLRKEDMEIYMFRLLLEWGRLTDDRRDQLGFAPA